MRLTNKLQIISIIAILFFLFSVSCKKNDYEDPTDGNRYIKLLDSMTLTVPEPSGLCMSHNDDSIYVVSDHTNRIYKLTLDGKVDKTLPYDGKNIQGIACNRNNMTLYVLETTDNKIINITREGVIRNEIELEDIPSTDIYESIAFIDEQNKIILFKRDLPGHILELYTSGDVTGKYTVKFANNYGGACYESERKLIWVVSDSEKKMYTCTPRGSLVQIMDIDAIDAEGIGVRYIENKSQKELRIYIVSDSFQKLFIYRYKFEG